MGTQANSAATQAAQLAAINAAARKAIQQNAIAMEQNIFSQTGLTQQQVNVIPRNVGLITGFWVKVQATVVNGSAVQIDLTDLGPSNILSQIQFYDLQNNIRIQTPGWHLNMVNSLRARRPFGTAFIKGTGIDSPINYGSNWAQEIGLTVAGASTTHIAAGATGILTMWYWVPIAYSEQDLRGCIYANVLNATMQLNLSLPGAYGVSLAVANATDSTQAVFVGDVAGSVALVTATYAITVYQRYFDQLPTSSQGVLLPVTDMATLYELKQTVQTAIPANQDFGFQYPNFRDFISTTIIYVNTAAGGLRGVGADINYWALQAANATYIWKDEPALVALKTRNMLGTDMPPGCYYFPSRNRPISTTQYGNMQLVLNAATAAIGAYQLIGVEDFALQQMLSMAGSLPSA
jgi:hypothetical protein